jgi:hypothetical protein
MIGDDAKDDDGMKQRIACDANVVNYTVPPFFL